jgi:hypothetical protein
MPTTVLERLQPRDAGVGEFEELVTGLFEDEAQGSAHGASACVSTCVSGLTWRCDGRTFRNTCISGWTIRCDG